MLSIQIKIAKYKDVKLKINGIFQRGYLFQLKCSIYAIGLQLICSFPKEAHFFDKKAQFMP
jgi:hypothetical protein